MPGPALLTELFDKAILEVKVLENVSEANRQLIEEVLAASETISHAATAKGENCQAALSQLTTTAGTFWGEVHSFVPQRVVVALEGVETAAGTVGERAKALWVQAKGRAEDLEQQRARLETELEQNRQATRTAFVHAGQTVQALGAAVVQQAAAAHAAIDTLRQGVTDARTTLNAAKDRFLQSLHTAEQTVDVEVDLYQEAIHTQRTVQTEGLIGLANTMVDAHNIAVADVRDRLVDELPAELWRAVGSLEDGIKALKTIRDDAEAPLDRTTAAVQAVVKRAQEALLKVREFSEQAKSIS
jgi:hypothetical protein